MSKAEIKVLNPRGEVASVPPVSATVRLGDLSGRKIGILFNDRADAAVLLPFLEEALRKRLPNLEIRMWRVPYVALPDIKEPLFREMVEYADAVIALFGG